MCAAVSTARRQGRVLRGTNTIHSDTGNEPGPEGADVAQLPAENVLRAETASLRFTWATLMLGVLGFIVYAVTSVAATQLDGVVSLIDAGTAFVAIRSRACRLRDRQPESATRATGSGKPLCAVPGLDDPGVVIAGVATNGAKVIDYLITREGELPGFRLAAVYTAFAAVVGFLVVANHRRNNRKIGGVSRAVDGRGRSAQLDAWLSAGICGALLVVAALPGTRLKIAGLRCPPDRRQCHRSGHLRSAGA